MANPFDRLEISYWDDSLTGRREYNEDLVKVFPDLGLFVIADGMGGGDCGDRAAREACERTGELWRTARERGIDKDTATFVMRSVNTHVYDLGREQRLNLGTTLTFVAVEEDRLIVGHIGDTRLYRIRAGHVQMLTEDDRAGGNQLSANIGGDAIIEPLAAEFDRRPGDVLLLATDGFWSLVPEDHLQQYCQDHPPDRLGQAMMADAGRYADDNCTLLTLWDKRSHVDWWRQRVGSVRQTVRESFQPADLERLRQAVIESDETFDESGELRRLWSADKDEPWAELVRSVLSKDERTALFAEYWRQSPQAACSLAVAVLAGEAAVPEPVAVVQRAYELQPTAELALFLLKRTDPADRTRFRELAVAVLREEPGVWFQAWTLLWGLVLESEQGAALCRDVADEVRLPGGTLLHGVPSHPLDEVLARALAEKIGPLERSLQETQQQQTDLIDELQAVRAQLRDLEAGVDKTASTDEALQREVQKAVRRLDGLEARIGPRTSETLAELADIVSALEQRMARYDALNQMPRVDLDEIRRSPFRGHEETATLESGSCRRSGDSRQERPRSDSDHGYSAKSRPMTNSYAGTDTREAPGSNKLVRFFGLIWRCLRKLFSLVGKFCSSEFAPIIMILVVIGVAFVLFAFCAGFMKALLPAGSIVTISRLRNH